VGCVPWELKKQRNLGIKIVMRAEDFNKDNEKSKSFYKHNG